MQIAEPMTMLTDYGLALLCAVFASRLWRRGSRSRQGSVRLFAAMLASMAIGAAAGGTVHGLAGVLGEGTRWWLWKVALVSVGTTAYLLLASTALSSVRRSVGRLMLVVGAGELVAYCAWIWSHDEFIAAIYDYVPAMLVVLLVQLFELKAGRPSAAWLVGGIVVSFAAAGVQQSGWDPHRNFNHNDLYHVVQMVGVWLLYRGGDLLSDRKQPARG